MSAMPEAKTSSKKSSAKARSFQAADPDILGWVAAAVDAAADKKAFDLKILHLGAVTDFTDFFVLASGSNERQVQTIAEAIEASLRGRKVRPLHIEGASRAQWVLLDYGDFVCHIFDDERRAYYALERLWSDAPDVTAHFAATPPAGAAANNGTGGD